MITPIKKIIINVDFSEKSLNALNTAIQMAKRHLAELHLLYVMDTNQFFPAEGMLAPIATFNEDLMKNEVAIFKDLAESIALSEGINCFCHEKIGFPVRSLCDMASQLDCDLIVVPTERHNGEPSYFFDSKAYRILKNVNCPILTVPADKSINAFKNVLFPLRPKTNNMGKYEFCRAILKRNNANVAIMGLSNKPDDKTPPSIKEMISESKSWLEADKIHHMSGVASHSDFVKGINNSSQNFDADLIVIDASTERNLFQYFFGNYTQRMINNHQSAILCYQNKSKKIKTEEEEMDFSFQLAY